MARLLPSAVDLLITIGVVAAFYLTGAISFDVIHVLFQIAAWSGGVALLHFKQSVALERRRVKP